MVGDELNAECCGNFKIPHNRPAIPNLVQIRDSFNNYMAQAHRFSKALVSLQPCHRLSVRTLFPSLPRSVPPRNLRLCITQRGLSVTSRRHAALAPSLPTQPTVVLCTPSPEYIEKEELDVDLLPPEQVKLEITDRAAEVRIRPLLYTIFRSQYHSSICQR